MRVLKTEYNTKWEEERKPEQLRLLSEGIIPFTVDMEKEDSNNESNKVLYASRIPLLMGQAVGGIKEQLPAAKILNDMILQASEILKQNNSYLKGGAKL